MSATRAYEILKLHNAWRRGEDERCFDELGFTVFEIGIAIDVACEALKATVKPI